MRAALLREAVTDKPQYERRRPEQTPLYRLVRAHYETFAAEVENATGSGPSTSSGQGLPQFIKDEFEAYLECGILASLFSTLPFVAWCRRG